MINGAFNHFPEIGPVRLRKLQSIGFVKWEDITEVVPCEMQMSQRYWDAVYKESLECRDAYNDKDLEWLVERFKNSDKWRILAEYFDVCSYFDIETTGLGIDCDITLIVCYHKGELHIFRKDHNLDDFLDLLDDVELLVSFNGSSFDVPRTEYSFHIGDIPCPHIDLRWICYYEGLKGGLKSIEKQLMIERPPDLWGIDGELAEWYWHLWESKEDFDALHKLERYCAADVISLKLIAARLKKKKNININTFTENELWESLNSQKLFEDYQCNKVKNPSQTSYESVKKQLQNRLKARRS